MSGTAMPANLSLVLAHLNAVRELCRYVTGKSVEKDLDWYAKEVFCPGLLERLPTLRGWHCEQTRPFVGWFPDSWKLSGGSQVSLSVLLPGPLGIDDNPSVSLCVPRKWRGCSAFGDRNTPVVKALLDGGFLLAAEQDGWDEDYPVGIYVSWLGSDRSFNESSLVDRVASEAEKIVLLEPEITEAIHQALVRRKGTKGKGSPAKTSRTA